MYTTRMTSTNFSNNNRFLFNFNQVQLNCKGMGIKLQKNADNQLQSAYSMQGLKAVDQKTHGTCYIFVGVIEEGTLSVSSFYNGALTQEKELKQESQIAEFVRTSVQIMNRNISNTKSVEAEYKEVETLFENLNSKSQKILKNISNQMMAVQEIKSSPEYLAICNQIKKLSAEVQQSCKNIKDRENKINMINQDLIDMMMEVQGQKQLLHEDLYRYSQIVKQLSDAEGFLNKFIAQKKANMQGRDFNDEQSFIRYLDDLTALKKLQNQKKYLSHI